MTKLARALLVVGLLAVGLAACGGDDDDSASAGTNTTVSSKDLEAAAKAAGVDKECLQGVQAYSALAASGASAFSGGSELDKSIKAFEAYAKAAPGAIKDDVKVLADAYTAYFRAVSDSGWDPSSGKPPTQDQAAAISAAGDKIDSADVKTASDKVSKYFDEHCKGTKGG